MLQKIFRIIRKLAPEFHRRDYREFLLEQLPPDSVGGELGVWKGDFSADILRIVQPRKLFLIDPWQFQDEFPATWYGGAAASNQQGMDAIHEFVKKRFAGLPNVTIIRKKTEDLTEEIVSDSLDWAYIDGNHHCEHVLFDLRTFAPLIKPGGILCGDDYDRGEGFPVTRAVQEFLDEKVCALQWTRDHQFFLKKLPKG